MGGGSAVMIAVAGTVTGAVILKTLELWLNDKINFMFVTDLFVPGRKDKC